MLIYILDCIAEQSKIALNGAMEFNEEKTRNAVDILRVFRSQLNEINSDAYQLIDEYLSSDDKKLKLKENIEVINNAFYFITLFIGNGFSYFVFGVTV